jgi:hypothetical protein
MIETVELVCKRVHMPYPNVRIRANDRIAIGPPWLAEALCVRGFFEKVSEDVVAMERTDIEPEKPIAEDTKKGKKGK